MSYIDKFLKTHRPSSTLEKAIYHTSLSFEGLGQILLELSGRAKPRIREQYIDENTATEWMYQLSNTLEAKFFETYFHPKVRGEENIPKSGAMLVANHSGLLGWDAMAIVYSIFKKINRVAGGFGHRAFGDSDLVKTIGSMAGNRERAISFLKEGRLGLVFPGGAREYFKSYSERYKLKPVAGFSKSGYGYILTALASKVPILPVAVVGAEETHIQSGNIKPYLDFLVDNVYSVLPKQLMHRITKSKSKWDSIKAFSLPLNLMPFPTKINVYVGRPLYIHHEIKNISAHTYWEQKKKEKMGTLEPAEADEFYRSRLVLATVNRKIMAEIQGLITEGLEKRKRRKTKWET